MRGIGQLKQWCRRVTAPFRPNVVILLYHRVLDVSFDPQRLCVSPVHFKEHLEIIKKSCTVLSLHELHNGLELGRLPKRGVVVTFDDGYADNLWNAKPLLERYGVPATVFVTTGYSGHEREFWWDELEFLLFFAPSLPEVLEVEVEGMTYRWELKNHKVAEPLFGTGMQCWHVEMKEDPSPLHLIYRELHRLLRPLPFEGRETVLQMLRKQTHSDGQTRLQNRVLTPDEICQLVAGGLVEVGAHTVTHPLLSAMPVEKQRWEIMESKCALESIMGREVKSFSYPYGGAADVGQHALRLVQESGYQVACANVAESVSRYSNQFWLSRFLIRDWDGEEFALHLEGWFYA